MQRCRCDGLGNGRVPGKGAWWAQKEKNESNHGNVDDVLSEALDGKFITQIYHCLSPCRIAECTESLLPPSRERFRADIKPTVLILVMSRSN